MSTIAPFSFMGSRVTLFGCGQVDTIGAHAGRFGRRALAVTGSSSAKLSGALERVERALSRCGVEVSVLEGVRPEPTVGDVDRGREALSASGADFVVAIGGGSAMDVGKAVAALARTEHPTAEFHTGAQASWLPALPAVPCVAIPTTSGTGAEVTPNSVLTDPERGVKTSIRGYALLPEVAIVDPTLTLSLPPEPTAHAGLDALCQAIEAYVSTATNPLSSAFALKAASLIAGALEAAVADGANLAAREEMALGSLLAGYALASARLGLVHGLAHPVGVAAGRAHGLVCGAMLPMVIRANAAHVGDGYAELGRAMGVLDMESGVEAGEVLADWVASLCHRVGVPTRLSDIGVTAEQLRSLAEQGATASTTRYNPRSFTVDELESLLLANL